MQINFQIFYASAAFTVDPGVEVNCRGEAILENSIFFSVTVVIQCVSRNTPGDSLSLFDNHHQWWKYALRSFTEVKLEIP